MRKINELLVVNHRLINATSSWHTGKDTHLRGCVIEREVRGEWKIKRWREEEDGFNLFKKHAIIYIDMHIWNITTVSHEFRIYYNNFTKKKCLFGTRLTWMRVEADITLQGLPRTIRHVNVIIYLELENEYLKCYAN